VAGVGTGPRRTRVWVISRDVVWLIVCALLVAGVCFIPQSTREEQEVWSHLSTVVDGDALDAGTPASLLSLRQQLETVARIYDAPPINARVDGVYRLIPGLAGVRLNMAKTLANPGASPLVFDQMAPETGLSDFVAEPIYQGNPQKRQMALMINVAWGTEYVPQMLSILRQYHVSATFFLDGSWTAKHPEVARQIAVAGMELGNHAYTHPAMSRLSRDAMIAQITRTNQAIEKATGMSPALFAPPSGDFNQMVVRVAAGLKMRTILWTLDTIDWRKPPAATIVRRILPRAKPGALVLMHPTAGTVAALPEIIQGLQKQGYQLVTVSALISPYRPVPRTIAEAQRGHPSG